MTSSAEPECRHRAIKIHVQPRSNGISRKWIVTEASGATSCDTGEEVFDAKKKRPAVQRALKDGQARADSTGRSIEVRVGSRLPKFLICGSREYWFSRRVLKPKRFTTALVQLPRIPWFGQLAIVLFGGALGFYILWRLHSARAAESEWPGQLMTAFAVVASIVTGAAFTVTSRLATDHEGPWTARQDVMMRANGLAAQGVFVLVMTFVAAFFDQPFVRGIALTLAMGATGLLVSELVHAARRLTSYAAEAQVAGSAK